MRGRIWFLMSGFCLMTILCSGCGPNILEGDDPSLVGTWQIVDEKSEAEEGIFTITQDRIVVDAEILEISGAYGVNAGSNPKQIDVLLDEFDGGLEAFVGNFFVSLLAFNDLRVLEGIYEVDAESLRIYLSPRIFERPLAFPGEDEGLGTGEFLLEARRIQ